MCLSVRRSFLVFLSLLFLSVFYLFSSPHSTCSLPGTPSSMSSPPRVETTALTQNEECCPMAIYNPLSRQQGKRPSFRICVGFSCIADFVSRFSSRSMHAEVAAHSSVTWRSFDETFIEELSSSQEVGFQSSRRFAWILQWASTV